MKVMCFHTFATAFLTKVALAELDAVSDGASLLQTRGSIRDDLDVSPGDQAWISQSEIKELYTNSTLTQMLASGRIRRRPSAGNSAEMEYLVVEGSSTAERSNLFAQRHSTESVKGRWIAQFSAAAGEKVQCQPGCKACGFNWYKTAWNGGNTTSAWDSPPACLGGTPEQQDVCKAVCVFDEAPPVLDSFAYGNPTESRKNGWYGGCLHRVGEAGPVQGLTIEECRQKCLDNDFEGASGDLGQYIEPPFCDAFEVYIPGWNSGDRKGGCHLHNFADEKRFCYPHWGGGYWNFFYVKTAHAARLTPTPLDFRGSRITVNNLGGAGPGAGTHKKVHYQGITADNTTDMLVTNATEYRPWKPRVNGFETPTDSISQLSLRCGEKVTLRFSFVNSQTGEPKSLPLFNFTVADLDKGDYGRCVESVEVSDYTAYLLPVESSVEAEVDEDIGVTRFVATEGDSQEGNPGSLDTLSDEQKKKSVIFSFTHTQSFTVTFSTSTNVNSTIKDPRVVGYRGRKFLFG